MLERGRSRSRSGEIDRPDPVSALEQAATRSHQVPNRPGPASSIKHDIHKRTLSFNNEAMVLLKVLKDALQTNHYIELICTKGVVPAMNHV